MDKNDLMFDIAILIKNNWKRLIEEAERRHGMCPRGLKISLRWCFWEKYSPYFGHYGGLGDKEETSNIKVMNNAVWKVTRDRDLHIQLSKTYIGNFSLWSALKRYARPEIKEKYKEWMKKKARKINAV